MPWRNAYSMALPVFNETGDLPPGVHDASLDEVVERFGSTQGLRHLCTQRLQHVYSLAQRTAYLQRFIIFGSYITAKPEPNDVDVILVMDDGFRLEACIPEARALFDHAVAQARYGVSVFWIRPGLLFGGDIEGFITSWQRKRDGGRRGIVEVRL